MNLLSCGTSSSGYGNIIRTLHIRIMSKMLKVPLTDGIILPLPLSVLLPNIAGRQSS